MAGFAAAAAAAAAVTYFALKAAAAAVMYFALKASAPAAIGFAAKAAILSSPLGIAGIVVGAILLIGLVCLLPFAFRRNPTDYTYSTYRPGFGYANGYANYADPLIIPVPVGGVGTVHTRGPLSGGVGNVHTRGPIGGGIDGSNTHTRPSTTQPASSNTHVHPSTFGGSSIFNTAAHRAPVSIPNPHVSPGAFGGSMFGGSVGSRPSAVSNPHAHFGTTHTR